MSNSYLSVNDFQHLWKFLEVKEKQKDTSKETHTTKLNVFDTLLCEMESSSPYMKWSSKINELSSSLKIRLFQKIIADYPQYREEPSLKKYIGDYTSVFSKKFMMDLLKTHNISGLDYVMNFYQCTKNISKEKEEQNKIALENVEKTVMDILFMMHKETPFDSLFIQKILTIMLKNKDDFLKKQFCEYLYYRLEPKKENVVFFNILENEDWKSVWLDLIFKKNIKLDIEKVGFIYYVLSQNHLLNQKMTQVFDYCEQTEKEYHLFLHELYSQEKSFFIKDLPNNHKIKQLCKKDLICHEDNTVAYYLQNMDDRNQTEFRKMYEEKTNKKIYLNCSSLLEYFLYHQYDWKIKTNFPILFPDKNFISFLENMEKLGKGKFWIEKIIKNSTDMSFLIKFKDFVDHDGNNFVHYYIRNQLLYKNLNDIDQFKNNIEILLKYKELKNLFFTTNQAGQTPLHLLTDIVFEEFKIQCEKEHITQNLKSVILHPSRLKKKKI